MLKLKELVFMIGVMLTVLLGFFLFSLLSPSSINDRQYMARSEAKARAARAQVLLDAHHSQILSSLGNAVLDCNGQLYVLSNRTYGNAFSFSSLRNILTGMEDHPIMQLKVNQNPHVLLNSASLPLHLDCSRMKKMANKPNSTVSEMTAARDTLIVLTTKNNLQMTMLALDYLKSAQDDADLIIIDDNSSDGTVEYLIKRGYAVFGKSSTTGWTDSLNRGYQIAYQLGYSYVIYTTNDVLVSSWAVRGTKDALKSEALIAPLTSKRGADHNPSQAITLAYGISHALSDYTQNFRNFEAIERGLNSLSFSTDNSMATDKGKNRTGDMEVELKRKSNRFANRNVSSKAGQKNKFHGFFFGINMEIMNSVAHNLGLQLLPTTYSLAGQEDYKLLQLMSAKNYTPKIALDVFVYHFKALPRGGEATSDVATAMLTGGKSLNEKYIRRQNISLEAIKALSEREMSRKNDHHTDELRDKTPGFSRRRLRHHEDRQSYFNNANANATIPTADELMMIKPLPQKYTQIRYNGGYNYPFASMRTAQSLLSNNAINFPTLYEKYKSLYTDIELRTYPTCSDAYVAYPKNATDEVCASYVESARIVIAIAVSDFENNPSASNAFVAEELAEALERSYNVEVKYLKQGSTWYSPRSLYGVDILIAMKEDYELPLAHKAVPRDPVGYGYHSQSRSGAKSTLFSIAWMLNSYDKWLSKPWIGNYDLILTGSMLGKDFYDKISTSIGLQVQCFMSCPTPSFSSYLAPEGSRVAQRFTETIELISRRSYVPVEVLRLATDNLKFSPLMVEDVAPPMSSRTKDTIEAETNHTIEESDTNQRIDYLFTGSYRDDRELLKFNPSMLPQWKGMFVGDGWDKVNLSSSWRSATIAREKSYRDMPTLYQSAKIIVDDCDETTKPWAGVTSRVFNGLATGKLVLTNGRLGMEEIFTADLMIPFVIPTYSSGSELAALLDYYLMNDLEREKLVEKMRSIVLTRHTYQHRANEFQILLNSFGFEISTKHEELLRQIGSDKLIFGIDEDSQTEMSRKDTIKVGKVKENKSKEMLEMVKADYFDIAWSESMCIGISVTEDDQLYLKQLLSSLGTQYTRSKYYRQIDMKIFVMDSDKSSPSFQGFLKEAADSMNKEFDKGMVSVLSEEVVMVNGYYGNTPRANKNKLLGLDVMDTLLDHITAMASVHHHLRVTRSYHDDSPDEAFGTAQQTHSSCNWVMLTHGNAIYNETWFETMVPFLLEPDYDLIGWDYMKPKRDRFAYVVDPKDGKYSSSRDGKSHNNIENDNSAAFNNTNLEKKDYKSSLADQLVAVTVDKNSATATNIGSLIIRESIYSRTGAKFLPEAIFTKDLYMREYALLMQLLETVRKDGIRLIHKCLLKYR